MTAQCVTSMNFETLLWCHQLGFSRLRGVPRQALYDNANTVTSGRDGSHQPVWQQRFFGLCATQRLPAAVHRPYHPGSKECVPYYTSFL